MAQKRCPGCPSGTRAPGKYLCLDCWGGLSGAARRSLNRKDSRAMPRLQELYRQLRANVPLAEIQVSP